MAEYRTIKIAMWGDPFFESLDAKSKLFYMYLFTSPHTNNLGVMEVSLRRICYETDLTETEVNNALDMLVAKGKVVIDGNFILAVNFIKNQTNTSPKMADGLKKLIQQELLTPKLFNALLKKYPIIFNGIPLKSIDTLSIPYAYPIDTLSIPYPELEREREIGSLKGEEEGEGGRGETPTAPPPEAASNEGENSEKPNYPKDFEEFWLEYPKKAGKGQALKAWLSAKKQKILPALPDLLAAIRAQKQGHAWRKDAGEYIPNPATWLNGQRWLDEVMPYSPSRASPGSRQITHGAGEFDDKNYGEAGLL